MAVQAQLSRQVQGADASVIRRLVTHARRRGLFEPGQKILVAVSGGPDSVALLSLLHQLRPRWNLGLSVVHVNYGLRGSESDEDAQFVRRLCERLNVPCCVRPVAMAERGTGSKASSLQERARTVRYAIMREVAAAQAVDRVALGHTAEDQAETILLWLLRGAGLTGLAGMPDMREGLFIRPLLTLRRNELLAYLSSQAMPFRIDSSNEKGLYRRNRIRHELMPCLIALAPSFVQTMRRQSDVLREEDRLLERLVSERLTHILREEGAQLVLDRPAFLETPLAIQRRIARRILRRFNGGLAASFRAVDAMIRQFAGKPSGARLAFGRVEAVRDGEAIRFRRAEPPATTEPNQSESVSVGIPGSVRWPATGERIDVVSMARRRALALARSSSSDVVVLDAATFTPALRVRAWRYGDRFAPIGMKGKQKKLQDFFTDMKVSRTSRHRVPLLTAPEGILWVAGYRGDERFMGTPSTTDFLVASLHRGNSTEGRD